MFCHDCRRVKMLFDTQEKADAFILRNQEQIKEESGYSPKRSYHCIVCGGWHVTSGDTFNEADPGQQVITELNYDERGYPESVSDEVKHIIVDDITHYIDKHFEHYKDDCKKVVEYEWSLYKSRHERRIKYWKFLFCITFFVLLVECTCRIIQ